ncbi:MAG: hypothetical protein IRZ13_11795 [Acetobacteraceae bacterium]|nr:hypothetical protein [Acetobacteraceae bacterium]
MQATPGHWQLERIKRRLEDGLAGLLISAPRVALLGMPPAEDLGGQLRIEGLETLLAARGTAVTRRVVAGGFDATTAARLPADATVLWLDGPGTDTETEGLAALAMLPPRSLVLMGGLTAVEAPSTALLAAGTLAQRGWRVVLTLPDCGADTPTMAAHAGAELQLLPDPAHALWGLLDHHPHAGGRGGTCVLDAPPAADATPGVPALRWPALLPAPRLHALRLAIEALRRAPSGLEAWAPVPLAIARRRALEAARRILVGHDRIEAGSLGASLFAALLGRPFRPIGPHAAAIENYWRRWRALSSRHRPTAPADVPPTASTARTGQEAPHRSNAEAA